MHAKNCSLPNCLSKLQSYDNVYFGRQKFKKQEVVILPGYIVPSTGHIHSGFYRKEIVSPSYEVLCYSEPCSLLYLASKVL